MTGMGTMDKIVVVFITWAVILFFKSSSARASICGDSNAMATIVNSMKTKFEDNLYKARRFPLCISTNVSDLPENMRTSMSNLLHHIDSANTQKDFIPIAQSFEFNVNRITVPDPAVRNMRQWLRLTIKPKSVGLRMAAVIVQPVSSPLGLPFGQFRPDVKCQDDNVGSSFESEDTDVYAYPCLYRPKSAFRHPNVYMARTGSSEGRSVAVSFEYINVLCDDVTAFQFMLAAVVIAQGGTNNYILELSPTYVLTKVDGVGGFPSPYHSLWTKDKISCNEQQPESLCTPVCESCSTACPTRISMLSYIRIESQRKIIYNKAFDDCISKGTSKSEFTLECPPGPFTCNNTREDERIVNQQSLTPNISLEGTTQQYIEKMTKSWASCPHDNGFGDLVSNFEQHVATLCVTNEVTVSTTLRLIVRGRTFEDDNVTQGVDPNKFNSLTHVMSKTASLIAYDRIIHGKYMIAAWFVVNSISTFWARYYKETGGKIANSYGCFGMKGWLWGHILLSFVFMWLMWISIIKPVELMHCSIVETSTKNVDFKALKKCTVEVPTYVRIHKYLGFFAFGLANFNFVIGWIRPLSPKSRLILTSLHSLLGHILPYIALALVFLSKVVTEVKLSAVALVVVQVLANIVATCNQWRIDLKSGVGCFRRKLCPIQEVITQKDCVLLDTLGVALQIVILLFVYGLLNYFYQKSPIWL